jgi:hypothetical protein
MPRYVIERNFGLIDDDEMQELAARSKLVGIEQFSDIEWEHSHVCNGGDGGFKSYCVYRAPDPTGCATTPRGSAATSSTPSTRSSAT